MKSSAWATRVLVEGLLVICSVGLVACEPVFQKYLRVSEGMTFDEVVQIMGSPRGNLSRDTTVPRSGTYTWEDSGGVARLYFEDGILRSREWQGWM